MNFFSKLIEKLFYNSESTNTFDEPAIPLYPHADHQEIDEDDSLELGDIVLLYWISTSTSDRLPGYFEYDYKINPQRHRNKLVNMGFLKSQKSHRSLARLKVVNLKAILKKYNLPVSGKKDILIQRIMDNYSITEADIPIGLCLTEDGEEIIKENQWIVDAHRDVDITPYEFQSYRDKLPHGMSFDAIKQAILIDRINKNKERGFYGSVRSDYLALAETYQKQNKLDYMMYYILVTLLDASGISHNLKFPENDSTMPIYDEDGMLNSYVVNDLRNIAEERDHDEYLDCFKRAERLFRSFNEKTFLTNKDIEFIRDNILVKDLRVIEKYLSKYSKYTYDYYL
ncbi:SAP domain-containing protein [Streptococcus sp. 10F2]